MACDARRKGRGKGSPTSRDWPIAVAGPLGQILENCGGLQRGPARSGRIAGFVTTRMNPDSVKGQIPHSLSAKESNHLCAFEYCGCSLLVSATKAFTSSKFLRIKLILPELLHHFIVMALPVLGNSGSPFGDRSNLKLFRFWRWRRLSLANEFVHCGAQRYPFCIGVVLRELMDVIIKCDRCSHGYIVHQFQI